MNTMEKEIYLDDLHIGKIVEEIAGQQKVSAQQLVDAICHYHDNAGKIFKLKDMNTEDVVKISYVLKYNLLEMLSEKYIPHLSTSCKSQQQPYCIFELHTKSNQCKLNQYAGTYDFLKSDVIHIGKYIRSVAEKKGLTEEDLGKLLHLSQSNVSRLYHSKSIKVKRMIRFSNFLEHNLFSELYLTHITIAPSQNIFDHFIIKVSELRVDFMNPQNGIIFRTYLLEKG